MNWLLDNIVIVISSIPTVILFFAFFRLNKRQKEAEVKQTEAGVKQTEAGIKQTQADALINMQTGYAQWTQDADEKFKELKGDILELKREGQKKDFVITDLKRKTNGLEKFTKELKQSLTEVEKIACIKIECPIREPKIGEYKHKKEA